MTTSHIWPSALYHNLQVLISIICSFYIKMYQLPSNDNKWYSDISIDKELKLCVRNTESNQNWNYAYQIRKLIRNSRQAYWTNNTYLVAPCDHTHSASFSNFSHKCLSGIHNQLLLMSDIRLNVSSPSETVDTMQCSPLPLSNLHR